MIVKIAVVYGLGGKIFDPPSGQAHLLDRLKEIGIEAAFYEHYDSQGVYDFMKSPAEFRGIVGDSLGACNAPLFAQQYGKRVDYIAGFQPSLYGVHQPVPSNVVRAHCIYDPYWIDTGGLGAYRWELAPGNHTTKLIVTEHRGAHPDDWGYSQDMVFHEIKSLIGAK